MDQPFLTPRRHYGPCIYYGGNGGGKESDVRSNLANFLPTTLALEIYLLTLLIAPVWPLIAQR